MAARDDTTHVDDIARVIDDELAAMRPPRGRDELAGLAISGGGIRSATFALGVMQALARRGWMQRFDYLSTVSGGGYIGSSLTWLLAAARGRTPPPADDLGTSAAAFPFGSHRPGRRSREAPDAHHPGSEPFKAARVAHIREHGNYLTPDRDITAWSLLAVVLRGLVVSVAVYVPMLVVVMALLHVLGLYEPLAGMPITVPAACGEPLATCVAAADGCTAAPADTARRCVDAGLPAWLYRGINGMSVAALLAVAIGTLVSLAYAAGSALVRSGTPSGQRADAGSRRSAFDIRRGFDWLSGLWVSLAIGGLLVLASLPVVDSLSDRSGGVAGSVSTLAGALSTVGVFRNTRWLPRALLAPVAAVLLVYGLLLMAWSLTDLLVVGLGQWWVPFAVGGLGIALGWNTNVNYLCVLRYYRDRLMEAFMMPRDPADAAHAREHAGDADGMTLRSLVVDGTVQRPYHLVNTNVVLVDADDATRRLRGGDAFLLSPLWCGSAATGWRRTESFIEGRLTLPTAMAISGAAVNPNTGAGGQGMTRNRTLSFLLVLLNLRLGFWAPNPSRPEMQGRPANFVWPGLTALRGRQSEGDAFVELSDGGHFENLAVYELLRRRCRVIVCLDGADDADYHFSDLANLIVRARADLGVRIDIEAADLAALKPRAGDDPDLPATAERGFAVARILYPEHGCTGVFVFLTTTFLADLPADVVSYKLRNPRFPDQSTGDQFFDEEQFEAYRELGYALAERMVESVHARLVEKGIDARDALAGFGA